MKYLIFPFISVLVLFTSCSTNNFSKEIDLDNIEYTPQLAVQAIYTLGSQSFEVYASKIQSQNTNMPEPISFSTRLMDEEGFVLLEKSCSDCLSIQFPVSSNLIKKGKEYTLVVESDEVEPVSATVSASKSTNLKFNHVEFFNIQREYLVSFDIVDNIETKDYYSIQNIRFSSGLNEYVHSFYPEEEIGSYFENTYPYEVVLPDDSFEDNSFRLTSRNYLFWDQSTVNIDSFEVEIITQNWSQELYQYSKSAYAVQESEYNPFFEPVSIVSNFDKGVGVFAIITQDTFIYQGFL